MPCGGEVLRHARSSTRKHRARLAELHKLSVGEVRVQELRYRRSLFGLEDVA